MSFVRFKKEEINQIMEIYSKKISIGEWKDYSISFRKKLCDFFNTSFIQSGSAFFQITKNHFNSNPFILSSRNSIIATSTKLKPLLSYLKKPHLKLVR